MPAVVIESRLAHQFAAALSPRGSGRGKEERMVRHAQALDRPLSPSLPDEGGGSFCPIRCADARASG